MEPLSSSNQMTTCEIGATFHGPDITPPTNPVHSSSRLTGVSLTVVMAAAAQDITSTATLSHILEGSEQQDSDIAAPNAELEFCQPQHMHYHQFQHPVECAIGISRYRELGDQKAQHGAGLPETGGGGVTPLMDGQQQDAEEFLSLYLNALDEELPTLLPSISGSQSASAVLEVEEHEASQSGQTEVGSLANLVESPIMHIFWGKSSSHVRTSNKPDVTTEDWRSLHLDIQHNSIHTIHIPQPQSGEQVSASGLGNASQQVLVEALPPVLVLHLNCVQYDAAVGRRSESRSSWPQNSKSHSVRFSFFAATKANYGTYFSTALRATSLQALWGPLPSQRIGRQRALYS
ncbi:hypothetical protein BGY98DRAFT_938352 [Russula aff. rugulosa BPL654]|nr:hypothetical protein BGY98DRAFT_938352 [Russula aff. rugulosa BPL654]